VKQKVTLTLGCFWLCWDFEHLALTSSKRLPQPGLEIQHVLGNSDDIRTRRLCMLGRSHEAFAIYTGSNRKDSCERATPYPEKIGLRLHVFGSTPVKSVRIQQTPSGHLCASSDIVCVQEYGTTSFRIVFDTLRLGRVLLESGGVQHCQWFALTHQRTTFGDETSSLQYS
jgi:hypothetical protein